MVVNENGIRCSSVVRSQWGTVGAKSKTQKTPRRRMCSDESDNEVVRDALSKNESESKMDTDEEQVGKSVRPVIVCEQYLPSTKIFMFYRWRPSNLAVFLRVQIGIRKFVSDLSGISEMPIVSRHRTGEGGQKWG
eukprot:GHVS01048992.1.p2 GENE.GHVS01048992.1~~GHVS01048992.1.p2  ORF type:complete len:135 (+),score=6.59 GHVS01048992.1:207-611(+)